MAEKSNVDPSEHFTKIRNIFLRSKKYTPVEKLVFCLISACGDNAFPGYEALMEWTGCARDTIWRALKKLEQGNAISRYKKGRAVHYKTYWGDSPIDVDPDATLITFDGPKRYRKMRPIIGLTDGQCVRLSDSTRPIIGLRSVRLSDSIKIKDKELIKSDFQSSSEGEVLGDNNYQESDDEYYRASGVDAQEV